MNVRYVYDEVRCSMPLRVSCEFNQTLQYSKMRGQMIRNLLLQYPPLEKSSTQEATVAAG